MRAIIVIVVTMIILGFLVSWGSNQDIETCERKAQLLDTQHKIVNGRCYLKGWGTSL